MTNFSKIENLNLNLDLNLENKKFKSKEFSWTFKFLGKFLKGQYRSFSKTPFTPLQMEFSESGMGGHVGKTPKKNKTQIIKKYGFDVSDCRDSPLNFKDFLKSTYKNELEFIFKSRRVKTGLNSLKDALNIFEQAFKQSETFIKTDLNAKIQALHLCYIFLKIPEQFLDQCILELYYASKKQGSGFGPYVLIS